MQHELLGCLAANHPVTVCKGAHQPSDPHITVRVSYIRFHINLDEHLQFASALTDFPSNPSGLIEMAWEPGFPPPMPGSENIVEFSPRSG